MEPARKNAPAATGAEDSKHSLTKIHSTPSVENAQKSQDGGRKRFVRLFPERIDFLIKRLTAKQFAAYISILSLYCSLDGNLQGEKKVRLTSGLPNKEWLEFVDLLSGLGIARLDGDRWVDSDQDSNIAIQKATSERNSIRALNRWRKSA